MCHEQHVCVCVCVMWVGVCPPHVCVFVWVFGGWGIKVDMLILFVRLSLENRYIRTRIINRLGVCFCKLCECVCVCVCVYMFTKVGQML